MEILKLNRYLSSHLPGGTVLSWTYLLPRYPVWFGSRLAFEWAKGPGVGILDLETQEWEPICPEGRRIWMRPILGEDESQIFLPEMLRLRTFRRGELGWEETGRVDPPGWTLWAESSVDGVCVGLCNTPDAIPSTPGHGAILRWDCRSNEFTFVTPRRADGSVLPMETFEFPTWWQRGQTIVVAEGSRHGGRLYVVDVWSGAAELLDDFGGAHPLHCFSSNGRQGEIWAFRAPGPDTSKDADGEELVNVTYNPVRLHSLGLAPRFCFPGSIALSPNGERLAFINNAFEIEHVSLPINLPTR